GPSIANNHVPPARRRSNRWQGTCVPACKGTECDRRSQAVSALIAAAHRRRRRQTGKRGHDVVAAPTPSCPRVGIMFGRITQSRRDNPLAFRLMGAILLISSAITLIAVLLLLIREFSIGVSRMERNLEQ